MHEAVRRVWTVQLHPRPGGPVLACPRCTLPDSPLPAGSARSAVLSHLAQHAQQDMLPSHLRTCQCRAHGCAWHRRGRGCGGPVLLALTRDRTGRNWRLADTCSACASATGNTAVVPDMLGPSTSPQNSPSGRTRRKHGTVHGAGEQLRVREMLTYLAVTLPRFTSPAARLLALQCALRADLSGRVTLSPGLLRGMRLHGRSELWTELAHAGWLRPADPRRARPCTQLLDDGVLSQAPGRLSRCRAAHWALQPMPLAVPASAPPAVQLTALVLASHAQKRIEMDVLARLSGHSHQQADFLGLRPGYR